MVCPNCFPNKPEGFYMDGFVKENLDILVKQIVKDFDFVILISGSGTVRVGKSVIGQQVGYYLNYMMGQKHKIDNTFDLSNIVFRGEELIAKAKNLPKYSVIVFDEAGADLLGRKFMVSTTQAVLDFFRECGQLNLFLVVILPDYFDLPKGIAITRSVCLLDVYFTQGFERGTGKFFGREKKKNLYIWGKKLMNYQCVKPDFRFSFTDFYTLDEAKYRELKYCALTGRKKQDNEAVLSRRAMNQIAQRNICIVLLNRKYHMPPIDIAKSLNITEVLISQILKDYENKEIF